MQLQDAFRHVFEGGTLTRDEAREVFAGALTEDADPVLFGGLLVALSTRRETADEVLGAAEALRAAVLPLEHEFDDAIDTCGTGGDGLGTFNLSTASAIVAAAAGAHVVKHGNRSVSSKCGSSDLLEAAGVRIELDPAQARTVLEEIGITYLHAPSFHPAMRFAGPVRRSLGVRTIFNLLGPLSNPGRVKRQLLGVADGTRVDDFAAVLTGLGHTRAYVVHGGGGADELTLEPGNVAAPVGDAPALVLDAPALGLDAAPVSALEGAGDAAANLGQLRKLFAGDGGPLRDALLLNSAVALVVAGIADDTRTGVLYAAEVLDSGAAAAKLATWAALTQAVTA